MKKGQKSSFHLRQVRKVAAERQMTRQRTVWKQNSADVYDPAKTKRKFSSVLSCVSALCRVSWFQKQ